MTMPSSFPIETGFCCIVSVNGIGVGGNDLLYALGVIEVAIDIIIHKDLMWCRFHGFIGLVDTCETRVLGSQH